MNMFKDERVNQKKSICVNCGFFRRLHSSYGGDKLFCERHHFYLNNKQYNNGCFWFHKRLFVNVSSVLGQNKPLNTYNAIKV